MPTSRGAFGCLAGFVEKLIEAGRPPLFADLKALRSSTQAPLDSFTRVPRASSGSPRDDDDDREATRRSVRRGLPPICRPTGPSRGAKRRRRSTEAGRWRGATLRTPPLTLPPTSASEDDEDGNMPCVASMLGRRPRPPDPGYRPTVRFLAPWGTRPFTRSTRRSL